MRSVRVLLRVFMAAGLLAALAAAGTAAADSSEASPPPDPHAMHRSAMTSTAVSIDRRFYTVPDVTLENERGQPVRLRELLSSDQPLAINFIFTSCTSICPVQTATFLQVGRQLAGDPRRPHFVSISIDPDYDSAAILKSYAERYGAEWTFLTGQDGRLLDVLRAFDAYRGGKNNHIALTLMRSANSSEWTRIEGLASSAELVRIWKDIAG